jgi:hypothetical protein
MRRKLAIYVLYFWRVSRAPTVSESIIEFFPVEASPPLHLYISASQPFCGTPIQLVVGSCRQSQSAVFLLVQTLTKFKNPEYQDKYQDRDSRYEISES